MNECEMNVVVVVVVVVWQVSVGDLCRTKKDFQEVKDPYTFCQKTIPPSASRVHQTDLIEQ